MKIEVLGPGCVDCTTLYENTRRALAESGKSGDVVKVQDIQTMLKYGIMSPPALVVDGQVICSGKLATVAEIKQLL